MRRGRFARATPRGKERRRQQATYRLYANTSARASVGFATLQLAATFRSMRSQTWATNSSLDLPLPSAPSHAKSRQRGNRGQTCIAARSAKGDSKCRFCCAARQGAAGAGSTEQPSSTDHPTRESRRPASYAIAKRMIPERQAREQSTPQHRAQLQSGHTDHDGRPRRSLRELQGTRSELPQFLLAHLPCHMILHLVVAIECQAFPG